LHYGNEKNLLEKEKQSDPSGAIRRALRYEDDQFRKNTDIHDQIVCMMSGFREKWDTS
jgi:hypothetical protein